MSSRFTELVVDCADADELATFWSAVLGQPITTEKYGCPQVPAGNGVALTFIEVPEAKSVKNRLHIDLNPTGCTQAEELERLLGLGARRIDIGQGDKPWAVLADPEGNEFCLLRPTVEA